MNDEKIILGNKIVAYLMFIHPCWEHFPDYMCITVLFYLLYGALKSHLTRPRNPYD